MNTAIRDFYYESTDGLQLYCAIHPAQDPNGLPVLCMPGLTRNSRDFARLAAHLSRHHEVLAMDLRGQRPIGMGYQPARATSCRFMLGHLEIVVLPRHRAFRGDRRLQASAA